MQREITAFNNKYKTTRVFFGLPLGLPFESGLLWISLEEYGINRKIKTKKSTQTFDSKG